MGTFVAKILTRLHGTNFCTTSARFASSFVRQPNGPEYIQIVQYTPKLEFRFQWGGSVAFVAKNSDMTSWHELLHQFGPFCIEFCKATKRSKCIQIVQNTPKHEFMSQRGQSGVFVVKNYNATLWHELLHQFVPFCTEFCKVTKRSQMHHVGIPTRGPSSQRVNAACFLVPDDDARGNTVTHGLSWFRPRGRTSSKGGVRGHCIILHPKCL